MEGRGLTKNYIYWRDVLSKRYAKVWKALAEETRIGGILNKEDNHEKRQVFNITDEDYNEASEMMYRIRDNKVTFEELWKAGKFMESDKEKAFKQFNVIKDVIDIIYGEKQDEKV